MLKFSFENRKINAIAKSKGLKTKEVCCFDLPAGYSCPAADICLSKANKDTGKISDGKNCEFRCYAASTESAFPSVRRLRWHNFDMLRSSSDMVELIEASLPKGIKVIRLHSSGDFFSLNYFRAWHQVAINHPEIEFFGYTKILPYVNVLKPNNFNLIYSTGGKHDKNLKAEPFVKVFSNLQDMTNEGLTDPCIDDPAGDFDFIKSGVSFGLLIHGTQPAKK